MNDTLLTTTMPGALPLWLATEAALPELLQRLPSAQSAWLTAHGFTAERGRVQTLPSAEGRIGAAVVGLGSLAGPEGLTLWDAAGLPERLPTAVYGLGAALPPKTATQFALGWLMGGYRLQRYRSSPGKALGAQLSAPIGAELSYVQAAYAATTLTRDLINAPPNELGPEQLAAAAAALAGAHDGQVRVVSGDELQREYPLIAAVGAASARAPRLDRLPLAAGPAAARVTLVGKGVCFDTGGLDLKPSAGMLLMKKDMGGAACALGLAQLLLAMRSAGRVAPADSRRREQPRRQRLSAQRRLALAQGPDRGDRQHRCRGPARAGRCAWPTPIRRRRPICWSIWRRFTGAARTALGPELPAACSATTRG
jgi:leucyl aminopeptidase